MWGTIEKLMNKKKVTAYAVAKATGISESTFTRWKNGKSNPDLSNLLKLSNYFNVPIEKLLEESMET